MRLLLALSLLWAATALADPYRFSRPVEWEGTGENEMLAIPLDSLIYAVTEEDYRDLRIVDQAGNEVPYLLEKSAEARSETTRLPCPSELLSLQRKGNGIELAVRLDKNAPPADGLTVATPLANFEYKLQIYGSDDGKQWTPLVKDAMIFDYSRYMAVANRDIPLPANRYRQFKLVAEEATQNRESQLRELSRRFQGEKEADRSEHIEVEAVPLHIDRIDMWKNQTEVVPQAEKKYEYKAAGFKVSKVGKETVIEVDTRREPLTAFRLQTTTENFSRPASVQIALKRGIETRQQEIGHATLQAMHFKDFNREETVLPFPEQRQASYRIVIKNEDSPPLEIKGIVGIGNGYRLVFLPGQEKAYRLVYGSEQAAPPRYDTAPILELMRRGYQAREVGLGPSTSITVTPSWNLAKLLNSQWFLGVAITLMVLAMGWALFRASKRIGQLPKE